MYEELSERGEGIGVEADTDNLILEPFDPDSISIDQKSVPMDTLIRRLKQQSIKLSPSFQRNEVWDSQRRSRLIESIMLKIPLPMFYVASDEDGRWEVVDGLQRLSTIRNFILGDKDGKPLVLQDLEFLGLILNGKTYKQIEGDKSQQRLINTIMETEMRFTVINPGTPEAVKRNIFKRINTGGLPLTAQEIRHALYQGPVTDLLIELVDSAEFKEAIGGKINDSRMGMRELIMYFLAFLVIPRSFYKGSVDSWLSNAMRVINLMPTLNEKGLRQIYTDGNIPDIGYKNIDDLKNSFKLAMTRATKLFGEHAFRKSLPGSRKTPVNKALFEVWSVSLCQLTGDNFQTINENKGAFLESYKQLLEGGGQGSTMFGEYDYTPYLLGLSKDKEKRYLMVKDELKYFSKTEELFPFLSSNECQQLDLLESGKLLDNAISRNSSEVESALKRYNLINNVISIGLENNHD